MVGVTYNYGRKGFFRNLLFQIRKRVPHARRLRIWRKTGFAILERNTYPAKTQLFRSIELETRTRCNSKCSFCAANVLTDDRPDILMPEALYHKLLDELVELDYEGSIKFFVNNEPLLDKRTAEFIRLACDRLPKVRTEVFTNGLKLNPRNGRELMEAGLQLLYINNYTEDGKTHRGVQAFLDEVAPDFPDRDIVFHLRLLDEKLQNRGGTAPNLAALPEPLDLPCLLPFEELIITADGRVTICCQDHYFDSAVGNANAQTLKEIWFNPAMEALRSQLAKGDRTQHELCKGCDFRGFKEEHLTEAESKQNRMVGDLWG